MNEMLVSFGGDLKSLGNGKYGGFLVVFSDENSPDLSGDFFTKSTQFFIDDGQRLPILYDHGFDPDIKREKIGSGKVTIKDEGLWLEFQLDRRAKYVAAIEKMCAQSKAGLSSGAAGHLVSRQAFKKASWVAEWGLAEASITPEPCEPKIMVMPLKSYQEARSSSVRFAQGHGENPACDACNENVIKGLQDYQCKDHRPLAQNSLAVVLAKHIADRVDNGHSQESIVKALARESGLQVETVNLILADSFRASDPNLKAFARVLGISFDMLKSATRRDYVRTIKGMFEEALADQTPSRWQLDSIYCDLMRKIAATAQASAVTGVEFDAEAKIKEATGEYLSRLESLTIGQVNEYVESGSDEPFYLKAIIDLKSDLPVSEGLDLEDHSQLAVSVLRDVVKRFWANHEARKREGNNQKAGRVLSDKNRNLLANRLSEILTAAADIQKLLDESQPMASEEKMRAAKTRHLALRTERRQALGV